MSCLGEQRGVTLVELLVVVATLGVVLGALATVFAGSTSAQARQSGRFQAQATARGALSELRQDLACGASALPLGTSDDITVQLPSGCSAGASSGYVEWCIKQASTGSQDWQLWRITRPTIVAGLATPSCGTSNASATRWADYLVYSNTAGSRTGHPFTVSNPAVGSGQLPTISINLPGNPDIQKPAGTVDSYTLQDMIALENGARG